MAKSYDYIIVGAGSAGCVLADRLSADPSNSVLLIEAGGPDNNPYIKVPAGYIKLHRSKVDWGYSTEAQEYVNNRKIYLPRGKTLGGCSSTNAMAYVRGNKEDYNDWAKEGNQGWSYDEVLPYFIKSEFNEDINNSYHGNKGKLNVRYNRESTPFPAAFVKACLDSGMASNNDYNGAEQKGAGLFQFTIKNGKRHSGVDAFLRPAMKRENLTVLTHTFTEKILIENDIAKGVHISRNGKSSEIISAKKEVILSAGAFGSPHILMLSGLGSKDELEAFGINCKKEIQGIGKNLQDHLFLPISASSKQQLGQNHNLKFTNEFKESLKFFFTSKGPLSMGPLEAVAFESTSYSPDRVDYQLHFASFFMENYSNSFYDSKKVPRRDGFTILPTLLRPESRGTISLASRNPRDFPLIQPNFLSAESDRKVLLEATKKAIDLIQSDAFAPYRKDFVMPSKRETDEDIHAHIRKSLETVYHPVGTCKMGQDEMAVVDEKLRVYGIERLRVIDASIMPTIVSGNTNAPVYMIAEKGADMILNN